MAALVCHRAGDLRGPAQGRREAAEEVAEPGLRLPARRSSPGAAVQAPSWGAGPLRPSGVACEITETQSETTGEIEGREATAQ